MWFNCASQRVNHLSWTDIRSYRNIHFVAANLVILTLIQINSKQSLRIQITNELFQCIQSFYKDCVKHFLPTTYETVTQLCQALILSVHFLNLILSHEKCHLVFFFFKLDSYQIYLSCYPLFIQIFHQLYNDIICI